MAECDRADVGELRGLLQSPEVQKDPEQYLHALQRVIACMTHGIDVSKLFSEMIMAGATTNLVQKKLVYLYLSNYAESNPELALLTVNTLQKDYQDWNPVVRGLALRTMFSLKLPDMMKYVSEEALQSGLKDKSAYVRKTAVLGIVKVFCTDPEVVNKISFVDLLYDRDPQVVSNCISVLVEVLASEGGMIITTKIAHYLLNRLRDFSEWGQCQVLKLLERYHPASEDELFDMLNILDERLKHSNSGVVLATVHLFLRLTDDMPHLHQDVYDRIKSPLLTMMGSKSSEVIYTCLQHAQVLLARQPQLWTDTYQTFYCKLVE